MIINIKTEYDFLKSIITVDEVIQYALKNDLKEVGICEVGNSFSSYEFYNKCKENNIKAIYGQEVYYNDQQLLLYAKNNNGFKRLNEIVQGDTVFFNEKEEDLVCILGKGVLIDHLNRNKNISYIYESLPFFDTSDIFIGTISYLNDSFSYNLFNVCMELNLPYIYIDQIRYLNDSDFDAYFCLRAIEKKVATKELVKVKYKRHTVKQLNNKDNKYYLDFVNKVNVKLDEIKGDILKYEVEDSNKYLYSLAHKGLEKRGFSKDINYVKRLDYELDVINKMGFSDYFLIVFDIIRFAKNNNIMVGPGRGSAAGSLVSYCIGITTINPVKEELLFERFLNPMRKSMPDIDIDFEDNRREDIVDYIVNRFSNAAKIATVSRLKAKSAFRDVAKAIGFKKNAIEIVSKQIDPFKSFEENYTTNKKLSSMYQSDMLFRDICDIIKRIEGLARQSSIHAAGVVVCDQSLTNVGITKDNVITLEAKTLESIGMLKIDILALTNLTFLNNMVKRIRLKDEKFTLEHINYNDPKTLSLLSQARTLGIFQLEKPGMREVLKNIGVESVDELANILSLYRPGPAQYIELYKKNKNKFVPKTKLDKILYSTNGIMVYQEQIMQVVQQAANYNLGESDILRRAISKKDEKLILDIKGDFIKKTVENGYEQKEAQKIFNDILQFAGYGFNKAHAYSYAKIAYELAYVKANYPSVFLSELFKLHFNGTKRDELLYELNQNDIKLLCPDILLSKKEVSAYKNKILLGLNDIKGLKTNDIEIILQNRDNLTNKSDIKTVIRELFVNTSIDQTECDNLVNSGAFDNFSINRATLRHLMYQMLNKVTMSILKDEDIEIINKQDLSFDEEAKAEFDALKINIKYNKFDNKFKVAQNNSNAKILTVMEAHVDFEISKDTNKYYLVFVKVISVKEITTKKGDLMAFITLESPTLHDAVVFNQVYTRYKDKLSENIGDYLLAIVSFNSDNIYLQRIQ